jgi:hypothetical protein
MDGGVSGLDWPAAITSLSAGLDLEFAKLLLAELEHAYVQGWWARGSAEAFERQQGLT